MKILALHTNTGSRFYRIIPQLKWMQQHGHEVRLERHDTEYIDQKIAWCDVLVLQMVFSKDLVAYAKSLGKKVVFECDDLIHKTHKQHYAYKESDTMWKRTKWLYRIWQTVRLCDGFIVSNKLLKKTYGWMCKRTFVFPNYMEFEHWLKEPKKNTSKRIRILWAGSTSHTGDLHWVKPIMYRILAKYPQVEFIYVGHGGVPTDDLYTKFIYGEDIFADLPKDHREAMLPAPANVYPYILSSLQADIAIAPLEQNEFNRYKTQCKYYEYGINGIPGVYSKWFYDEIKDTNAEYYQKLHDFKYGVGAYPPKMSVDKIGDTTGLLAETPAEWISALSLLIENATLRDKIGENAHKAVMRNYNFADHAKHWQGFIESL